MTFHANAKPQAGNRARWLEQDTDRVEHHPEGRACQRVGKAEQIKQILKSSWQRNKTAPNGCLSWLGVQALAPFFLFLALFTSWFHSAFISLPASPIGAGQIITDTQEEEANVSPQTLQT